MQDLAGHNCRHPGASRPASRSRRLRKLSRSLATILLVGTCASMSSTGVAGADDAYLFCSVDQTTPIIAQIEPRLGPRAATTIAGSTGTIAPVDCGMPALGKLVRVNLRLRGVTSCMALSPGFGAGQLIPTSGIWPPSGSVEMTFDTASSSDFNDPSAPRDGRWRQTNTLKAEVRLYHNQIAPVGTHYRLFGLVTKGVMVGADFNAGFAIDWFPTASAATAGSPLTTWDDYWDCVNYGSPRIGGARLFTSGTTAFGQLYTDYISIGYFRTV